jgi:hypothetical protein
MCLKSAVTTVLVVLVCSVVRATSQGAAPTSENLATLTIINATASSTGVNVDVRGSHIASLAASIDKQDASMPTFIHVVRGFDIPNVPDVLRNVSGDASATINLPIVIDPDASARYRLTLFAKSTEGPGHGPQGPGWITAELLFKGYSRPVPDTFKLEFGPDALNVSVSSSERAKLKAQWQVGENTVESIDSTGENPKVSLKFSSLGQGQKTELPTLILTLEKQGKVEEARILLAVAADQTLSTKVQKFKDTTSAKQQDKANFSWKELASSGIGAILKYFLGVI